jgi:hypothetical protein
VSVESFNHIFLQIQQTQQKEIKAEKTRKFEEVFELMIILKQCTHQAIENRLEALRRNNDDREQDQILGPCGHMCWFCWGKDMIPIDSRKDLKSILKVLLVDGNVESNNLPKLLLEKRQTLGKSFFAPKATK